MIGMPKFKGFKSVDWCCRDESGNIYGHRNEVEAREHVKLFGKKGMQLCRSTTIVEVVKP